MSTAQRLVAAVSVALAIACSIAEVDLAHRACPCVDSTWACVDNTCVPAASIDASDVPDSGPPGAFVVKGLTAEWATPETIRWRWTTQGNPSLFGEYTLVIGTSLDDVTNQRGAARSITKATNLELGVAVLPHSGFGDPVLSTSTTDLLPATTYYAQLRATDSSARVSISDVAFTTTPKDATKEMDLFGPSAPAWTLPCSFRQTCDDGGVGGGCYLEYKSRCSADASCGAVDSTCYANLTAGGLAKQLDVVNAGTAFLELLVNVSGWSPGFNLLQIQVNATWFSFPYLTLGNDQWRLVQVPLNVLHPANDGGAFRYDGIVNQLQLGSTWTESSTVRIAQARIRYSL